MHFSFEYKESVEFKFSVETVENEFHLHLDVK